MRITEKIVLASMNSSKFCEFQALFSIYPAIELISMEGLLRNAEKLALVETHSTYLENAIAKARLVNLGCHYPSLADDTGLEVKALGGRPGARSHRYAKLPPGTLASRAAQDLANNKLLLSELSAIPGAPRTAHFITVLALEIEGILLHSTGVLEGNIAEAPRGANGFGYDSVFIPKNSQKTLAEMTDSEKNSISHRARAVHDLMSQIKAKGIVCARP
jgi:XTP/dITP diphosphohydrolase